MMNKLLYIFWIFICLSTCFCSDIKIMSSLTYEKEVNPGDVVAGSIDLYNSADSQRTVKSSLVDYLFYADGTNEYNPPGSISRSNANWIKITPSILTIAPKTKSSINFEITIPKDEKLTGSYWSMLLIEPQKKLEKTNIDENQVGLQTVLRYGYQIISNIANTGQKKLKVIKKQISIKDDKKIFILNVENTGEVKLTPKVWMDVFDEEGKKVDHLLGDEIRIYPTCSAKFLIDISSLKKGKYQALIVFENEKGSVFGSQYSFELPQ
jgi:hypothetical protein